MIVPGRPVADHEVSVSMPLQRYHRRHRHAPLLHATEGMKVMCNKKDRHPRFNNEPEIIGEEGEKAELPPKEAAESVGPRSAEKRRGMIYTPQALRPAISAGKRDMSGTEFESFLKQLDCSIPVRGEVHLCDDGEVSPRDVSRPLFTTLAYEEDKPTLCSEKTPDALRLGTPAERFRDAAGTPTLKPFPNSAAEQDDKATPSSMATSKILPTLLADEIGKSMPGSQIARKPLPSPTDKKVEGLPTSPQVMKLVSAMAARSAEFSRMEYAPVVKYTALRSHRTSEEERDHSIWLSEGWKLWKSKKMLNGGGDSKGDAGKCSESRAVVKSFQGGVKAFLSRR